MGHTCIECVHMAVLVSLCSHMCAWLKKCAGCQNRSSPLPVFLEFGICGSGRQPGQPSPPGSCSGVGGAIPLPATRGRPAPSSPALALGGCALAQGLQGSRIQRELLALMRLLYQVSPSRSRWQGAESLWTCVTTDSHGSRGLPGRQLGEGRGDFFF